VGFTVPLQFLVVVVPFSVSFLRAARETLSRELPVDRDRRPAGNYNVLRQRQSRDHRVQHTAILHGRPAADHHGSWVLHADEGVLRSARHHPAERCPCHSGNKRVTFFIGGSVM